MVGLLCDECFDERHTEWVAGEWSHMGEESRREAWERSNEYDSVNTPDWETVRDSDELPLYPGHVYQSKENY